MTVLSKPCSGSTTPRRWASTSTRSTSPIRTTRLTGSGFPLFLRGTSIQACSSARRASSRPRASAATPPYALFGEHRIAFTPQWSVIGGVRFDHADLTRTDLLAGSACGQDLRQHHVARGHRLRQFTPSLAVAAVRHGHRSARCADHHLRRPAQLQPRHREAGGSGREAGVLGQSR